MQLQELCCRRSRVLYRDQALYLQVLRDELLERTRQALFTLISNVEPSRFAELSSSSRERFQSAVADLTQRCSVLLTAEQSMVLAQQLRDEARRHEERSRRDMVKVLGQQMQRPPQANQASSEPVRDPKGSVHLSLIRHFSSRSCSGCIPGNRTKPTSWHRPLRSQATSASMIWMFCSPCLNSPARPCKPRTTMAARWR